jgi:hypothetical protein
MSKFKFGDRMLVKLSGGRLVEATVKASETTAGPNYRLFRNETALI